MLEALEANGQRGAPELSKMLNMPLSTVKHSLLCLRADGQVKKIVKSPRVVLYEVVEDEG